MASENEASCESDPNFAVICGFLEKFGVSCGLTNIDFLDLQEMLENTQEVSQELVELHIKLLRRAKKSVMNEKWEKALIKLCHSYCSQDAWELERFGYKKSRISSKLRILKQLLEMQFDHNQRFKNSINRMSANELRTQPLGRDRLGHAYWCQCDESCQIRVYKEDPDEETWTLVARNREGLVSLISQLTSGDSAKSSSEPVSNEDSNSLEVEKPTLDTGQNTDSNSSSKMESQQLEDDTNQETIKKQQTEDEKPIEKAQPTEKEEPSKNDQVAEKTETIEVEELNKMEQPPEMEQPTKNEQVVERKETEQLEEATKEETKQVQVPELPKEDSVQEKHETESTKEALLKSVVDQGVSKGQEKSLPEVDDKQKNKQRLSEISTQVQTGEIQNLSLSKSDGNEMSNIENSLEEEEEVDEEEDLEEEEEEEEDEDDNISDDEVSDNETALNLSKNKPPEYEMVAKNLKAVKENCDQLENKGGLDLSLKKPPQTLRLKPITQLLNTSVPPEPEKKEFIGIKGRYIRGDPSGEKIALQVPSFSNSLLHGKAVQSASFDAISYKRSIEEEDYHEPTHLKRPRLDRPTLLGNKNFQPPYVEDEDYDDYDDEVEDEIEEPLLSMCGEGSGYVNQSGNTMNGNEIVGDAIEEPVMFVVGEGSGRDNTTGNDNPKDAETSKTTDVVNDKNLNSNDDSSLSNNVNAADSPKKLLNLVSSAKPQYKLGMIIDSKTDKNAKRAPLKKSRWDVGKPVDPSLNSYKNEVLNSSIPDLIVLSESRTSEHDLRSSEEGVLKVQAGKVKELVDKFETIYESQLGAEKSMSDEANREKIQAGFDVENPIHSSSSRKNTFFFGSGFGSANSSSASLSFGASKVCDIPMPNDDLINISDLKTSMCTDNSEHSIAHSDDIKNCTEISKTDNNAETSANTTKVPEIVDNAKLDNNINETVAQSSLNVVKLEDCKVENDLSVRLSSEEIRIDLGSLKENDRIEERDPVHCKSDTCKTAAIASEYDSLSDSNSSDGNVLNKGTNQETVARCERTDGKENEAGKESDLLNESCQTKSNSLENNEEGLHDLESKTSADQSYTVDDLPETTCHKRSREDTTPLDLLPELRPGKVHTSSRETGNVPSNIEATSSGDDDISTKRPDQLESTDGSECDKDFTGDKHRIQKMVSQLEPVSSTLEMEVKELVTKTDVKLKPKIKIDPDIEIDLYTNTKGTKPAFKTSDTEAILVSKTVPSVELKTKIEGESNSRATLVSDESNVESAAESDIKTVVELGTEAADKLDEKPSVEAASEKAVEAATETAVEASRETVESELDTKTLVELGTETAKNFDEKLSVEAASETALEVTTETAAESDSDTETAVEATTETAAESDTETVVELGTETAETETAESESDTKTVVEVGTETAEDFDEKPSVEVASETAVEATTGTVGELGTETAEKFDEKPSIGAASETAVEAASETAVEAATEAAVEATAATESESNTKTVVELGTETLEKFDRIPSVEAGSEITVEAATETAVEAATETAVEAVTETAVEAATETTVEATTETTVGATTETTVEVATETTVEVATETTIESDLDVPEKSGVDIPVKSDTESSRDSTVGAPESGTNESMESSAEATTESSTKTESEFHTKAPLESGTKPCVESGTKTEVNMDMNDLVESDTKTLIESSTEAAVKFDMKTTEEWDDKASVKPDTKTSLGSETTVGSDTKTTGLDTEASVKPETKTSVETSIQSPVEREIELNTAATVVLDTNVSVKPGLKTDVISDMESNTKISIPPHTDVAESDVKGAVESDEEVESDTKTLVINTGATVASDKKITEDTVTQPAVGPNTKISVSTTAKRAVKSDKQATVKAHIAKEEESDTNSTAESDTESKEESDTEETAESDETAVESRQETETKPDVSSREENSSPTKPSLVDDPNQAVENVNTVSAEMEKVVEAAIPETENTGDGFSTVSQNPTDDLSENKELKVTRASVVNVRSAKTVLVANYDSSDDEPQDDLGTLDDGSNLNSMVPTRDDQNLEIATPVGNERTAVAVPAGDVQNESMTQLKDKPIVPVHDEKVSADDQLRTESALETSPDEHSVKELQSTKPVESEDDLPDQEMHTQGNGKSATQAELHESVEPLTYVQGLELASKLEKPDPSIDDTSECSVKAQAELMHENLDSEYTCEESQTDKSFVQPEPGHSDQYVPSVVEQKKEIEMLPKTDKELEPVLSEHETDTESSRDSTVASNESDVDQSMESSPQTTTEHKISEKAKPTSVEGDNLGTFNQIELGDNEKQTEKLQVPPDELSDLESESDSKTVSKQSHDTDTPTESGDISGQNLPTNNDNLLKSDEIQHTVQQSPENKEPQVESDEKCPQDNNKMIPVLFAESETVMFQVQDTKYHLESKSDPSDDKPQSEDDKIIKDEEDVTKPQIDLNDFPDSEVHTHDDLTIPDNTKTKHIKPDISDSAVNKNDDIKKESVTDISSLESASQFVDEMETMKSQEILQDDRSGHEARTIEGDDKSVTKETCTAESQDKIKADAEEYSTKQRLSLQSTFNMESQENTLQSVPPCTTQIAEALSEPHCGRYHQSGDDSFENMSEIDTVTNQETNLKIVTPLSKTLSTTETAEVSEPDCTDAEMVEEIGNSSTTEQSESDDDQSDEVTINEKEKVTAPAEEVTSNKIFRESEKENSKAVEEASNSATVLTESGDQYVEKTVDDKAPTEVKPTTMCDHKVDTVEGNDETVASGNSDNDSSIQDITKDKVPAEKKLELAQTENNELTSIQKEQSLALVSSTNADESEDEGELPRKEPSTQASDLVTVESTENIAENIKSDSQLKETKHDPVTEGMELEEITEDDSSEEQSDEVELNPSVDKDGENDKPNIAALSDKPEEITDDDKPTPVQEDQNEGELSTEGKSSVSLSATVVEDKMSISPDEGEKPEEITEGDKPTPVQDQNEGELSAKEKSSVPLYATAVEDKTSISLDKGEKPEEITDGDKPTPVQEDQNEGELITEGKSSVSLSATVDKDTMSISLDEGEKLEDKPDDDKPTPVQEHQNKVDLSTEGNSSVSLSETVVDDKVSISLDECDRKEVKKEQTSETAANVLSPIPFRTDDTVVVKNPETCDSVTVENRNEFPIKSEEETSVINKDKTRSTVEGACNMETEEDASEVTNIVEDVTIEDIEPKTSDTKELSLHANLTLSDEHAIDLEKAQTVSDKSETTVEVIESIEEDSREVSDSVDANPTDMGDTVADTVAKRESNNGKASAGVLELEPTTSKADLFGDSTEVSISKDVEDGIELDKSITSPLSEQSSTSTAIRREVPKLKQSTDTTANLQELSVDSENEEAGKVAIEATKPTEQDAEVQNEVSESESVEAESQTKGVSLSEEQKLTDALQDSEDVTCVEDNTANESGTAAEAETKKTEDEDKEETPSYKISSSDLVPENKMHAEILENASQSGDDDFSDGADVYMSNDADVDYSSGAEDTDNDIPTSKQTATNDLHDIGNCTAKSEIGEVSRENNESNCTADNNGLTSRGAEEERKENSSSMEIIEAQVEIEHIASRPKNNKTEEIGEGDEMSKTSVDVNRMDCSGTEMETSDTTNQDPSDSICGVEKSEETIEKLANSESENDATEKPKENVSKEKIVILEQKELVLSGTESILEAPICKKGATESDDLQVEKKNVLRAESPVQDSSKQQSSAENISEKELVLHHVVSDTVSKEDSDKEQIPSETPLEKKSVPEKVKSADKQPNSGDPPLKEKEEPQKEGANAEQKYSENISDKDVIVAVTDKPEVENIPEKGNLILKQDETISGENEACGQEVKEGASKEQDKLKDGKKDIKPALKTPLSKSNSKNDKSSKELPGEKTKTECIEEKLFTKSISERKESKGVNKEEPKDVGKEEPNDVNKEKTNDVNKEKSNDINKEAPKDVGKELGKGLENLKEERLDADNEVPDETAVRTTRLRSGGIKGEQPKSTKPLRGKKEKEADKKKNQKEVKVQEDKPVDIDPETNKLKGAETKQDDVAPSQKKKANKQSKTENLTDKAESDGSELTKSSTRRLRERKSLNDSDKIVIEEKGQTVTEEIASDKPSPKDTKKSSGSVEAKAPARERALRNKKAEEKPEVSKKGKSAEKQSQGKPDTPKQKENVTLGKKHENEDAAEESPKKKTGKSKINQDKPNSAEESLSVKETEVGVRKSSRNRDKKSTSEEPVASVDGSAVAKAATVSESAKVKKNKAKDVENKKDVKTNEEKQVSQSNSETDAKKSKCNKEPAKKKSKLLDESQNSEASVKETDVEVKSADVKIPTETVTVTVIKEPTKKKKSFDKLQTGVRCSLRHRGKDSSGDVKAAEESVVTAEDVTPTKIVAANETVPETTEQKTVNLTLLTDTKNLTVKLQRCDVPSEKYLEAKVERTKSLRERKPSQLPQIKSPTPKKKMGNKSDESPKELQGKPDKTPETQNTKNSSKLVPVKKQEEMKGADEVVSSENTEKTPRETKVEQKTKLTEREHEKDGTDTISLENPPALPVVTQTESKSEETTPDISHPARRRSGRRRGIDMTPPVLENVKNSALSKLDPKEITISTSPKNKNQASSISIASFSSDTLEASCTPVSSDKYNTSIASNDKKPPPKSTPPNRRSKLERELEDLRRNALILKDPEERHSKRLRLSDQRNKPVALTKENNSLTIKPIEKPKIAKQKNVDVETIDLTSENEIKSIESEIIPVRQTRQTRYQERSTDCKQGVMIKGVLIKGDVTIKVKKKIPDEDPKPTKIPVKEPECIKKNVPLLTCVNIEKLRQPDVGVGNFKMLESKSSVSSPVSIQSSGGDLDTGGEIDNNSSDVVIVEDDPLAGCETLAASVETVRKPLTLATFKLDGTESPPPIVTRSLRKRCRPDNEPELIHTSGGKRPKMKGKRQVDVELRKSIEEQKKLVISSSEDDNSKGLPKISPKKKPAATKPFVNRKRTSYTAESAVPSSDAHSIDDPSIDVDDPSIDVDDPSIDIDEPSYDVDEPDVDAPSEKDEPPKVKLPRKRKKKTLMGLDIPSEADLLNDAECNVRQSRRIAQLKIKEEAERRKIEEMALDAKQERKSKSRKNEDKDYKAEKRKRTKNLIVEEEVAVDVPEPPVEKRKKRRRRKHVDPRKIFDESNPWRSSSDSSTSNNEDEEEEEIVEYSEAESPLFKSDHEFSPESDLEENGEVQPLKRARTARKEDAVEEDVDEHACQKCGKSDHPEWILLCDGCDNGWHCSCLRPPLLVIPEGDWFCPPCQHNTLIKNLEEKLIEYDKKLTKRGIEERRKERLAYVGISLANVLPVKDPSELKQRKKQEQYESSEESESETESSTDADSDEPIYQLRQRRQAHSYRFNDYDELINSAIQDEIEAVKGAGNQGRGKDISTIVNAEKEEQQAHKLTNEQEKVAEPLPPVVPLEGKELPPAVVPPLISEGESGKSKTRKRFYRKKHRKLNCLDVSSGDDQDSDEDFKGSSSDEPEDDFEENGSESSESYGRRRDHGVRRSTRARTSRYDREFIDDNSDDDDAPRRKKTRPAWDDDESESEESDRSWGRRKRKTGSRRRFTLPRKRRSRKPKKYMSDSDNEVYRKKKPKIKYGGLDDDDDEEELGRRTRGKKINYLDALASDSEEEVRKKRPPRIESDDEYDVNEEKDAQDDDEAEDEDEVKGPAEDKSNEVLTPPATEPQLPDKQIDGQGEEAKPDQPPEAIPVQNPIEKEVEKPPENEFLNSSEEIHEDPDLQENDDEEDSELNPIEEINKNLEQMNEEEMELMMEDQEYATRQLQLMAMQLEKEKKRKEREAKRKEKIKMQEQKIPKKRGRKPKASLFSLVEPPKSVLQFGQLQVGPDTKRNSELSEPPGVTIPIFTDIPDLTPDGTPKKRRGRGKGKKTLQKEQVGPIATGLDSSTMLLPATIEGSQSASISESSIINSPIHGGKLTVAAPPQPFSQSQPTPSVITRMLQSQPGNFALGMAHKYFADPIPHSVASSGSSVPPVSGPPLTGSPIAGPPPVSQAQYMHGGPPPRGLPSPYRQPPPGMSPYSAVRGSPTAPHRLRAPPPQGMPPMYHTHHPLDPSPSGGGPVSTGSMNPSTGPAPSASLNVPGTQMNVPSMNTGGQISQPGTPLNMADQNSPGGAPPTADSPLSNKSDQTPPPPPYPRSQMPRFPPGNSSPLMTASPIRHPHLLPPQHMQQTRPSMPYMPGMPPNYYGAYMPPSMPADESLPPPSYQYGEQFSDGSSPHDSGKGYDEENSGEFGGLVSYFSSQREDDLDT